MEPHLSVERRRIAEQAAEQSPIAVSFCKRLIHTGRDRVIAAGLEGERDLFVDLFVLFVAIGAAVLEGGSLKARWYSARMKKWASPVLSLPRRRADLSASPTSWISSALAVFGR